MIEAVANLLYERLEANEVEHDARAIQLTFDRHGNLIVVAVQRLSFSIGKNQKMGGRKIKIILRYFDAKTA